MAGGTSRQPGRTPLGDRVRVPISELHGSVVGLRRPPGPDPMAPTPTAPPVSHALGVTPGEAASYAATVPQHVRVTHPDAPDGHVPGLLLEWRRAPGEGWTARVAYAEHVEGRWVLARTWLSAERVEPT